VDDNEPPLSAYDDEVAPDANDAAEPAPKPAPKPAREPAPKPKTPRPAPSRAPAAPAPVAKPAPAQAAAPLSGGAQFPWEAPLPSKGPASTPPVADAAPAMTQRQSDRERLAPTTQGAVTTKVEKAGAVTKENFGAVITALTADRGGSLKMIIPLLSDLELIEVQDKALVIGIPMSSDHAILASRVKTQSDLIARGVEDFCGLAYNIEWREIVAEKRTDKEADELAELQDEVEQLPIFGQLQHEFGAELRRGDKRR
jgi:hypothetical protein